MALIAALCTLLALRPAVGQYVRSSGLFDQLDEKRTGELDDQIKNLKDLEDIHYPKKYLIDTDFYVWAPPSDYVQNVIFDPCRDREFNCCNNTYGTPEFRKMERDQESVEYGYYYSVNSDGSTRAAESSRIADDETFVDEECTGFMQPRENCLRSRLARRSFSQLPACWNYNETITSGKPCRAPKDGSPVPLCMELGITQTAFIVQCGGDYAEDPHCGTFLEVHRPGDTNVLSEVRLRGQYVSGYKMAIMSTVYRGNESRVLCEGDHEIWWVQRTRYDFKLERRIPFRIVSPRCDWDSLNNRYHPYATLATAEEISGVDAFAPERLLFTRQRVVARQPGLPGRGMGSTFISADEDEYPTGARFEHGDLHTFTYTPDTPAMTVEEGELWPYHSEANVTHTEEYKVPTP